jgi:aspartyl-tRNA(Asn)/glutamyl-tRNA(Gln) amidotransferase subunit A
MLAPEEHRMDLLQRPLTDTVDRLKRRDLSPVELMEAVLGRIDATQDAINAFVALRDRDELLEAARSAEQRIARGESRALEGVPLGVKDLEDAEGLVTSKGSVPFRENLASRDSVQVGRLKAAGAIVVGKTNAPEFGYTAITKNLLFGASRNPWNTQHTPGGSSGGSSAAISGGVIPLATASDGGGSVRLPASFTGCFGLKPSYGRIPCESVAYWDMGDTAVHGPLTRTVADAALHLDVAAGPDPLDPNSLPAAGVRYSDLLAGLPPNLRVGFSYDLGFAVVQSDIAETVYDAARVFETLGHRFEEVKDGIPEMGRDWGMVGSFELLGELGALLPEHEAEFGRSFIAGVKAGAKMDATRWGDIRRRRADLNRWCADVFSRFDLLLTPTVPFDPPAAKGPFPAETEGRPQPPASVGSFTIPFNLSWHPAATVRAGLSRAGLPVGLQIVGPRHRDDLVLQAAYAFERERPWADVWPTI